MYDAYQGGPRPVRRLDERDGPAERAVVFPASVFFLVSISFGSPHVLMALMGHTCGEPTEIELTAAHWLFYRSFPSQATSPVRRRACGARAVVSQTHRNTKQPQRLESTFPSLRCFFIIFPFFFSPGTLRDCAAKPTRWFRRTVTFRFAAQSRQGPTRAGARVRGGTRGPSGWSPSNTVLTGPLCRPGQAGAPPPHHQAPQHPNPELDPRPVRRQPYCTCSTERGGAAGRHRWLARYGTCGLVPPTDGPTRGASAGHERHRPDRA